tara:strand:- start:922 stop:2211 length:1290 start_codon:yes stop_codon:yes gene_type:complete
LLVVELNEFDPVFLRKNAIKLKLQNILYFLNLNYTETFTLEEKEHHGLDPWVQWVSIHSGLPFSKHKIARLGQTKKQNNIQIWNKLGENYKLTWGVWGVMNAPCGNNKGRCFFVPDPWSFDEIAYPSSLNQFISLPKYMAKNYLSPELSKVFKYFLKTSIFMSRNICSGLTRKIFKYFLKAILVTGINIHSLTTLLDYINCLYFIKYKNKYNPNFSIIFLNHIAHLQHHFWNKQDKLDNQMKYGLIICNEILGELKKSTSKDEPLLLLNGLKQKNVFGHGFYLYRQKHPENFIKQFITFKCSVNQNMTNDGTLKFDEIKSADKAEKLLKEIKLKLKKCRLFYIERLSSKEIFYQMEFSDLINKNEKIIFNEKEINFFEHIELFAERTGVHIPSGDIFYKNIDFPNKLENHEIFKYIEKKFKKRFNFVKT